MEKLIIRKEEIFTIIGHGYEKVITGPWYNKKTIEIFPKISVFIKNQQEPWIINYKTEDEMLKGIHDIIIELENKSSDFIDLIEFKKL